MSWSVCAVPLPDGDRPVDLWVDAAGCLVTEPVAGAERLPGRYVVPGLVDAHAHPAVAAGPGGPVALSGAETLNVLATQADCGVCLVRDAGSPGGLVLQLDLIPGMPRLQHPPGRSEAARREIWNGRAVFEAQMLRAGAIALDGTAPTAIAGDGLISSTLAS